MQPRTFDEKGQRRRDYAYECLVDARLTPFLGLKGQEADFDRL